MKMKRIKKYCMKITTVQNMKIRKYENMKIQKYENKET
jgi:hypothetical protein